MIEMNIEAKKSWFFNQIVYLCGRWPRLIKLFKPLTLITFYVDGKRDGKITVQEAFKDYEI